MRTSKAVLIAASLMGMLGAAAPTPSSPDLTPRLPLPFDGHLSVLTYNIHGLPWPVARGRTQAFAQIVQHLRTMREDGTQPHIIVLQEVFTTDARAIGRAAGYRYVVEGPGAQMPGQGNLPSGSHALTDAAAWYHGETLGKYVGSGLQILSDYPIAGVRKMAFPAFACAGFDCLANKGALLVSVALPGQWDRVDIVTTHLNSRRASRVQDDRSLAAYRLQVDYLTNFITSAHDPSRPLIVAGDFNVGSVPARKQMLLSRAQSRWCQDGDIDDAYGEAARRGIALSADARFSRKRARDWQFFTPGRRTDLELSSIDVPFGHEPDGTMLSDHVGYSATYQLRNRQPLTRIAPGRV
ncbi:endonuclease/exonuclease/phosphatase family protein [Sphingobium sp. HT1-2]|uniref:endonuclease/exonuclease/phosphatase family protein n=1 Tax=Sphingobium sp. HT1-2 TaxID=3111640 RepID=UPI003C108EFB